MEAIIFLLPADTGPQAEYALHMFTTWQVELEDIQLDGEKLLKAIYTKKQ